MKQNRASPDALQFYTELQQLTSVAACADLFKQTVAKCGIHAFACGEIDLAERDRNVMFIAEWPKLEMPEKSSLPEASVTVPSCAEAVTPEPAALRSNVLPEPAPVKV